MINYPIISPFYLIITPSFGIILTFYLIIMTYHGKKCFKSSVIWQKCVSIYENYWCWWLVWDDSSASGTGTFRGRGTAQFQLFLFVKITVGSWTNVWHSRIPTVMIICLVQQIRGIIQHTLEFVLNSQSSMLSSVFFNVPSNLCQHFRDTNVRNFTSEQHLCMITDLIYAALLRCSSLTPISVWFSRSEPQRTDKQHQARSKLGAGIGWRYGGPEGGGWGVGWSFWIPFWSLEIWKPPNYWRTRSVWVRVSAEGG